MIYYQKATYMNFLYWNTLFCLSKQYAIYENKDQAVEKQDIGKLKHMEE